MLVSFFEELRRAKVPVSLRELLDLLAALEQHLVFADMEEFYYLSRAIMVKDEKHYDKFDLAFGSYFNGLDNLTEVLEALIPEDWLRKEFENSLSEEEKAKIQSLGGLEELLEQFKKRMEEQQERHQGGNKWVGTGGTSPFGAHGYNPEGIRIGQEKGRHGRAVKVWDKREFKNLDDSVQLGTRNIKVALRRLRNFARTGAQEELDLDDTIGSTARNAGYLDIKMVPEKHNAVKVLLFMDVGGSMDPYIHMMEELFSATKTEFKHLEFYYFHNFLYESVWQDNSRRWSERTSTFDLMHKYSSDYKVIFIGDASMAPYEVTHPGGSVEHWNEEAGATWFQRMKDVYEKIIWLNPVKEQYWPHTHSIEMVRQLTEDKMFPLTLKGLEDGMRYLAK